MKVVEDAREGQVLPAALAQIAGEAHRELGWRITLDATTLALQPWGKLARNLAHRGLLAAIFRKSTNWRSHPGGQ
jgi:hypothetical protein